MERKKQKHAIAFPTTLNMSQFLGERKRAADHPTSQSDENMYELRGILLHKGGSAYHGHYEAQVYDSEYVFPFSCPVVLTRFIPQIIVLVPIQRRDCQ